MLSKIGNTKINSFKSTALWLGWFGKLPQCEHSYEAVCFFFLLAQTNIVSSRKNDSGQRQGSKWKRLGTSGANNKRMLTALERENLPRTSHRQDISHRRNLKKLRKRHWMVSIRSWLHSKWKQTRNRQPTKDRREQTAIFEIRVAIKKYDAPRKRFATM